ncbi:oligopeptide transporter-like protein [Hortaea werneckii]|nr:oligopeptide transporter-like protein [Hortaea werneckii]
MSWCRLSQAPEETPESMSDDPEVVGALAVAEENGGLRLPLGKLILWALGLCFFGVVFAVPLRKEVIVREKLRFPSGTATALMIGVLHGGEKRSAEGDVEEQGARQRKASRPDGGDEESQALIGDAAEDSRRGMDGAVDECGDDGRSTAAKKDWKKQIRLLTYSFGLSGGYVGNFIHSIPFLGTYLARKWLWSLNPSPAYVGQGIIMGPATTIHMLLGAIIGWAILSPLAKYRGWASGDVGDWNTGSKGWIVWVSLAIMLADAIVSLGWLVLRPIMSYGRSHGPALVHGVKQKGLVRHLQELIMSPRSRGYSPVHLTDPLTSSSNHDTSQHKSGTTHDDEEELLPLRRPILLRWHHPLRPDNIRSRPRPPPQHNGRTSTGRNGPEPQTPPATSSRTSRPAISSAQAPKRNSTANSSAPASALSSAPPSTNSTRKCTVSPAACSRSPRGPPASHSRIRGRRGPDLRLPHRAPDLWEQYPESRWIEGGVVGSVRAWRNRSRGVLAWYWIRWRGREETPMIVLASGLILGEGLLSIGVPLWEWGLDIRATDAADCNFSPLRLFFFPPSLSSFEVLFLESLLLPFSPPPHPLPKGNRANDLERSPAPYETSQRQNESLKVKRSKWF